MSLGVVSSKKLLKMVNVEMEFLAVELSQVKVI